MSVSLVCACPYIKDNQQCPLEATQEDLLCDFCSGRNCVGQQPISCKKIFFLMGERGVSYRDHLNYAERRVAS